MSKESDSALLRSVKKADFNELPPALPITDAVLIDMGDVGYANKHGHPSVLLSRGAGPCLIFAARNPETGDIALTHINPYNKPEDISIILAELRRGKTSPSTTPLEIHMSGAIAHMGEASKSNLMAVLRILEKEQERGNVKIVTADIYNMHDNARGLILDAKTGAAYVVDELQLINGGNGVLPKISSSNSRQLTRYEITAEPATEKLHLAITHDTRPIERNSLLDEKIRALCMKINIEPGSHVNEIQSHALPSTIDCKAIQPKI
ncbi:MAG: hypothetical protein V4735_00565 [Pseudomonadota bacterium]